MKGLTAAEARRRLARYGANEARPRERVSLAAQFARRFRNPLILILLAASAVAAFTGDVASFVIIASVIGVSVAIDFVQEHRAGRAAEALARKVQVHATVIRDGKPAAVAVARVVPGDVATLRAGSIVPADGTLIEAEALHVNEALITGEPFPAERRAGESVLMGTSVVSGTATMEVAHTGGATRLGAIARRLAAEPPPTSFERGTRAFGMLIMRLTAFLVLFVLLVNVALHRPLLESFLFAIALAVGLTPELLPMIVSVTLARGAMRLAHEHVIVKRLTAVEGLGSMDVLCTDKTGTLTEGAIRLERCVDAHAATSARVLELAALNSRLQAGIRSPLDDAILAAAHSNGARWRKLGEVPFDFERRRVSVLVEHGEQRLLVVKGAPEDIVARCDHGEDAQGRVHAWSAAERAGARATLDALSGEGLRVLAVACKETRIEKPAPGDERSLVFAGFAAFADPPKAGAAAALAALAASGVRLKILTGDNEAVTRHVCASLSIDAGDALDGEHIDRLDDPALAARAEAATLFSRVDPAQKERIVRVLKSRGHVVGFLGDGINDAPALHSADVGLSVHNAVDVAREAADLILMRRGLEVIHRGVLEGRRTFVNIRKYILMDASSNFGNMFSMAGASLFLPFLPMLPTQILLNNLLYDVSEIPIPLDRADEAETARPQQWDVGLIRRFMWTLGPVSSAFDFLTFYVLLVVLEANDTLFRTGWFVESLATQVLVIFVIRTRGSPFASAPSPVLAATSLAVVAAAVALPFTPLAAPLGFEPLPPFFLGVLAVLIAAYLGLAEGAKRAFFRRRGA